MKIVNMKCNHITNPMGFELNKPRLSWVTEADDAKTQLACEVIVAADEDFLNIIHDSGRRSDIDSIGYTLDIELKPCTRYFWKVRVWTECGDITSHAAWFETSKMNEKWTGKWISPKWDDNSIHPLLKKEFNITKEISQARLYICGLGLYEARINGKRVGNEYFTPYCNSYDNWIQYQTFDVTPHINKEDNDIEVMLGNGWYKGRIGWAEKNENIYGDKFALLCDLVIKYKDGSSEVICSDESFKATPSYVIESSIYDGEFQDANRKENKWYDVCINNIDFSLLKPRMSVPVCIKEKIKPVKIIHTAKSETVLDMGQNMVGWLSFKIKAPKGREIYMQYGEEMQDGCFYRDNLRSAKAEFKYISDGNEAVVQPHFTYYGFRYVKIVGWEDDIDLGDFIGCVVYSDLDVTGNIETSDPLVNRLFLNTLWGQKGNFLDVPTDCPQRDERMGWTGDAQMFSGTACFNMDAEAFFHKYMYDLAKEQEKVRGAVPCIIPRCGITDKDSGAAAWSDAATIIPWNLYIHYGDKSILKQQFKSMKSYVDSIRNQDDGSRLWNKGFQFGDWLALDGEGEFGLSGATPTDLIATAYYAYSSEIVSKAAEVLGKEDIAYEYKELSLQVKNAFCREFVSETGKIKSDTQTAYILALFMRLVPENLRGKLIACLKKKLEDNNYYLETGFVGTPYLCRVLSENGCNDLAYRLLMNDKFPSWLYEVKLGATTIWERWNSILPNGRFSDVGMNSLNHYAYGSVAEWMYRNMCGINPVEEFPGFKKVRLEPQPNSLLKYAKATLDTRMGTYESGWSLKGNLINFKFKIPFNAEGDAVLKDADISSIRVNGIEINNSKLNYYKKDDDVVIKLKAGSYDIYFKPTINI